MSASNVTVFKTSIAAIAALIAGVSTASAAVVVNDGFDDGNRTSLTPGGTATPKTSIPWFQNSTSNLTLNVASTNPAFAGNYLALNTSQSSAKLGIASFDETPVALTADGDKVVVSFDFVSRYYFVGGSVLGFGLQNTGTVLPVDNSSGGGDNNGYSFVLPTTASTSGTFKKQAGSVAVSQGTQVGAAFTTVKMDDFGTTNREAKQTATFTLTRVSSNQIDLALKLESAVYATQNFTASDSTATVFTFNEFAFGSAAQSDTGVIETELDNFRVEYVPVPEPVSLSILGLAGAACLRRRR